MNSDGVFREPITFAYGAVYTATQLNHYLYNNVLGLDNFANPAQQERPIQLSFTHPSQTFFDVGTSRTARSTRPIFVPWSRIAAYGLPAVRIRGRIDVLATNATASQIVVDHNLYQRAFPWIDVVPTGTMSGRAGELQAFPYSVTATNARATYSSVFYTSGWRDASEMAARDDEASVYLEATVSLSSGIPHDIYRVTTLFDFGTDTDNASSAPRF